MRYFPLFLDFGGRTALIAGGGEQAAQKARLLRRTDADLAVMAPDLDDELSGLVAEGRARHVPQVYDEAEVDGAFAVFCASGCVGVDAWIAERVAARGGVANVVDKPRLCTAITPSLVDRDPLVVAIGTEGVAPVLGQRVKTSVEAGLEPDLGGFLQGLRRLRPRMAEVGVTPSPRAFWNWIMDGPRARAAGGDLDGALAEVEAAVEAGGVPAAAAAEPRLTLVEAPEGGVDLISLRAVRRLQEADRVILAPGAAPEALELARRDAEREDGADWRAAAEAALAEGETVAALLSSEAYAAALARPRGPAEDRLSAARAEAPPES